MSESPMPPALPARTPEQRINAILAEGYAVMPTLIAPVSKTPVPVIDFLSEYLTGGWQISFQIVDRPKQ